MAEERKIYLSEQDMDRLQNLIGGRANNDEIQQLVDELDHAIVLEKEKIPPNIVTMNSKVCFEDVNTGKTSEVTLVYPKAADAAKGLISIFAPIGVALLGLAVGDVVEWPLPGGRTKTLKVLKILYQPEAAGDWNL